MIHAKADKSMLQQRSTTHPSRAGVRATHPFVQSRLAEQIDGCRASDEVLDGVVLEDHAVLLEVFVGDGPHIGTCRMAWKFNSMEGRGCSVDTGE